MRFRIHSTIAATGLFLFAFGAGGVAQMQSGSPSFDAVSIKRVDMQSHEIVRPNGDRVFSWKPVEFKGNRLSGDAPLSNYIEFACSPLLTPYRLKDPQSMPNDYYQIEAVAPTGTTVDAARLMLRKALAERLGFLYHVADQETPVYNLVPGKGALKLRLSNAEKPSLEIHKTPWELHLESAPIATLAAFLSGIAGRPVIDKTGLQGNYVLDLDWTREVQESMSSGLRGPIDPIIAIDGVKELGLRLEPGSEPRTFLFVDHINTEPTPN